MSEPLLDRARELGQRENGLAVVVATRDDGSVHATVVNAGLLDHPVTGEAVVGFVARARTRKLNILRARPRATVVFRSGWEWVSVEGDAELVGPGDVHEGVERGRVLQLLRRVYASAAGGTEENWAALDEVTAAEGHTAVLIRPTRVYSNPGE